MRPNEARFLADGSYCFETDISTAGELTARIITCEAWLFELYQIERGELLFVSEHVPVAPPSNRFGAWFPPFTISQLKSAHVRGRVFGIASAAPPPVAFPTVPIVFDTPIVSVSSRGELADVLRSATNRRVVDAHPAASALSRRAKRLIDQRYLRSPSIARVATQLGVTAAHLARQFKRDFDLTPREYLHQLRMADVPLKLASGVEITAAASDVGYNDLSRFYKQFRKATKTSPGACRTTLSPRTAPRRLS